MEKERYLKYVKICERAERMKIDTGDRMGTLMDIESADKKFNMRLDDWLQADDFNFAHDYCGIQNNIKRGEFPATDFGFFLPRFAGKDKKVLTTMQSGETCQCYGYYTDVSGVKWLYVAYKNVVGFASSKYLKK